MFFWNVFTSLTFRENNRTNAPELPHSVGISYFLFVIGSIYLFKKVNSPFYVGLWSSIMLRITVVLIGER